jgi:hypothetical protein
MTNTTGHPALGDRGETTTTTITSSGSIMATTTTTTTNEVIASLLNNPSHLRCIQGSTCQHKDIQTTMEELHLSNQRF